MLPKPFKTLLLTCSLLFICGCEDGPKVDICVSDPDSGGFQCMSKDQKTAYFVDYRDSRGMVGVPSEDFKVLVEWIKRNKK